ncbi:putative bifunctional diguanylate cyclase/phosphodiesterase [Jidongwangia harbinensis]|uniref:putative bifunctional diguanylate cyclase/phosphodiesterase n=1 Tax=Jidongwangia harbinensis TaxID=2878561 RepID=UPI001CDA0586|nr:bifunctional diguanylate cyclase/phosphodiesterase [Jidongwangia harbinensis]MCA2214088.1 EAL domain-containing protein [Jidongwangia harbinensis]
MGQVSRLRGRLRGWIPTGGGVRPEDWARRHRLLTLLLASTVVGLTGLGAALGGLDLVWLVTVLLILPCVLGAVRLRGRRLASILVALGFTVACGGFVAMLDGLTEAHFSFFIAVAALALYRDWAPFGAFLVATTLHHAAFGAVASEQTYGHHGAVTNPLMWAVLHGVAVLMAAGLQTVAWRLTESEEQRAQADLDESEAHLSIAFDQTPVPMAILTPDGAIRRVNPAYRRWLDLPETLPDGFNVRDLPLVPTDPNSLSLLEEQARTGSAVAFTREYHRPDGSSVWVEVHSNGLRDRQDRLRLIFVHCLDVTEVQRQVRQDALTGLLSRAGFEEELARTAAGGEPVSVLYLDVDRFKAVNDGSGHSAGDEALRVLAGRLTRCVPAGSLIARFGGDEFVAALPGPTEVAVRAGRAVVAAFAEPVPVAGGRLQLAASVGVATVSDPGQAEQAVLAADTAMYAAKRAGGNRLEIFSEQMRVAVRQRIVAEARLREALAGDRDVTLPVVFQPIVSVSTGHIVGAEALVRMRAADGLLRGPGEFIGPAEETGLIVPLGEHVLCSALRQLRRWGQDLDYVSVNVSPRQLSEADFVPTLARLLAETGLDDPARLVLEITETALLSTIADLPARLDAIKALGVRLALDDFGTGYSSLTWLQSVPADVVKLDRSFVAGLARDARKASIISAVLWLARSLGMTVVAEGVEEAEDWDALRAVDCPAIQGYYFSPPVPVADFEALLRTSAFVHR